MWSLLLTIGSLGLAQPIVAHGDQTLELLRDRRFEHGVRIATRSHYPAELREQARARWEARLPELPASAWEFIEIAETQNLSDNPDTPEVTDSQVIYASRDRSKRFEINRATGEIRFVIDTEREWRNGCNLAGLWDGLEPLFCRGKAWNWPHFLVSQRIRDPLQPDQSVRLDVYRSLELTFSVELVCCEIGQPNPCPPGAWGDQEIPNHCLFYAAVVLKRQGDCLAPRGGAFDPCEAYALFPLFCSWDGKTHSSPMSWLGLDPAGHAVYWAPNPTGLQVGQRCELALDFWGLAQQAVAAINGRYNTPLSPEEYAIDELLIGWEIWGPFRCDIMLGNLSLRALRTPGPPP